MAIDQALEASTADTERLQELEQHILALPREANWDSEDALPVTEATCRAAVEFLCMAASRRAGARGGIPLPSSVAPTTLGGVSLYWKFDADRFLVEIRGDDSRKPFFQWVRENGDRKQGFERLESVLDLLSAECAC